MAELLELSQLVEQHGVAEMKVGRARIEAGLDAQRLAGPQLSTSSSSTSSSSQPRLMIIKLFFH